MVDDQYILHLGLTGAGAALNEAGRLAFGSGGDVATLGLAFMSGAYLYTACCVVANEFYAPMMAELAGQVGHVVDRGWVALRLTVGLYRSW